MERVECTARRCLHTTHCSTLLAAENAVGYASCTRLGQMALVKEKGNGGAWHHVLSTSYSGALSQREGGRGSRRGEQVCVWRGEGTWQGSSADIAACAALDDVLGGAGPLDSWLVGRQAGWLRVCGL
jgi:hypothetical protein